MINDMSGWLKPKQEKLMALQQHWLCFTASCTLPWNSSSSFYVPARFDFEWSCRNRTFLASRIWLCFHYFLFYLCFSKTEQSWIDWRKLFRCQLIPGCDPLIRKLTWWFHSNVKICFNSFFNNKINFK